ncbi:GntR family transcriptional regulator [Marilutibacter aestuarii]|uniref:GntR family transcriptional regulator n=1 Tax=Marilutibacter aestuarii TaxID=1706195 RepID=A0A508AGR1_9GAMM|nr:GntR family transcriptional regulator [Lysobacter aestuarii]TQD46355.1 GntR family transcriptional regulator [Lysobacter aestuarii]
MQAAPSKPSHAAAIPSVESPSAVDAVVGAITRAVREGHVVPGQRLVELDFARRLAVSRSSVREAFQRLVADGLLAAIPNRGVTIRQLSRAEVEQWFELRIALESLAIRKATPVLATDPAALRVLLDAMDEAVSDGDIRRYSDLNRDLHERCTRAAGNPQLAAVLERLGHSIHGLQFRLMVEPRKAFETHAQHHRLVEAILANDADAAEREVRAHLETTRRLIQALPDHHFA